MPKKKFPLIVAGILLVMGIVPVVGMVLISNYLGRDCTTITAKQGTATVSFVWRIETERCGNGPVVTNVLVAPRGKSLALAASATGSPLPARVSRTDDGTTLVLLSGPAKDGASARMLPLKGSGRPARPLVLIDGVPIE